MSDARTRRAAASDGHATSPHPSIGGDVPAVKVALGQKVPQDRFVGKYRLSLAGMVRRHRTPTQLRRSSAKEERSWGSRSMLKVRILGGFLSAKHGDTAEADYPSNHTGYVYELSDEEWQAMLNIDATPGCEVAHPVVRRRNSRNA
jgi:hypothetical protein